MRLLCFVISLIVCALSIQAQDLGEPSIRGEIEVPIQLSNDDFKNFTESVVGLDLGYNYPIYKGVGLGAGAKGAFTSLKRGGDIFRFVYYGKLFYESMIGPSTMFEGSLKAGPSEYIFRADGCAENRQKTFHFDPSVALHFYANEFTSFGISLGYEIDDAQYTPDLVCDDPDIEPYSLQGGLYNHITFGLAFNVLFGERPQSQGVFN